MFEVVEVSENGTDFNFPLTSIVKNNILKVKYLKKCEIF